MPDFSELPGGSVSLLSISFNFPRISGPVTDDLTTISQQIACRCYFVDGNGRRDDWKSFSSSLLLWEHWWHSKSGSEPICCRYRIVCRLSFNEAWYFISYCPKLQWFWHEYSEKYSESRRTQCSVDFQGFRQILQRKTMPKGQYQILCLLILMLSGRPRTAKYSSVGLPIKHRQS